MTMKKSYLIITAFLLFLISACTTVPKKEEAYPGQINKTMSVEEQRKRGLEKFNEILTVRQSLRYRKDALPEMENLYLELIDKYPDAPIAQESYWKLVESYVKDYSPPRYDEAEELYTRLVRDYPQSFFRKMVERTLGVRLRINKEWERLLRISTPAYREYIEKGTKPLPLMIFSYAESNFWLGNYEESEKAFKVLIEEFPRQSESRLPEARIKYIRSKK
jgi:tetratricopeptide (TPR) repeat protein